MSPMYIQRDGKKTSLICAHWKTFPTRAGVLGSQKGVTLGKLFSSGEINPLDFQRAQVWEKECGLLKMLEAKCLGCKHARTHEVRTHVPVLVSLDGEIVTPTMDIPTMSALPRSYGRKK